MEAAPVGPPSVWATAAVDLPEAGAAMAPDAGEPREAALAKGMGGRWVGDALSLVTFKVTALRWVAAALASLPAMGTMPSTPPPATQTIRSAHRVLQRPIKPKRK